MKRGPERTILKKRVLSMPSPVTSYWRVALTLSCGHDVTVTAATEPGGLQRCRQCLEERIRDRQSGKRH